MAEAIREGMMKILERTFLVVCVGMIALTRGVAGQSGSLQTAPTALTVSGDVSRPLTVTLTDLKAMPRATATVRDDTRTINYEGVLVSDILSRAGVATGGQMRSPTLTMYVVATAKDGYQVVLSVGELDNPLSNANIIVADTLDGQPLPANVGPLRLILPKDARSVRNVRQLERLEVVQIKK